MTPDTKLWSTREHTGTSVAIRRARARPDGDVLRVGDLQLRRVPVVPSHVSMATARKVALLRQISLLLVERDDHIVGTIDDRALDADHDTTAVAAAMRPLVTSLRPSTPLSEARELFIRARAAILPVVAGGVILGAVTRSDIERARLTGEEDATVGSARRRERGTSG